MGMVLSRESFLHVLAQDALSRGLPEAAFLNFVDGKVRQAKEKRDTFDTFFKVIQDLKSEMNHLRNAAYQQGDDFFVMMFDSNLKILNAIV
jgi:hypothetical protein